MNHECSTQTDQPNTSSVADILSMLWNMSTHAHPSKAEETNLDSGLTPRGHGKALCACPWSLQGNGERMGCACLELFHLQRHSGFQATTSSETFHTHHVNKAASTYTHTQETVHWRFGDNNPFLALIFKSEFLFRKFL